VPPNDPSQASLKSCQII